MICSYTLLGYLHKTRGRQAQGLRLAMSSSSIASWHKGSLDTSVPLVSRSLLPICDLNSVQLRHLKSSLIGKGVAFPSSNGKSWNPHSVGHLTM